jgi:hypothetical protein
MQVAPATFTMQKIKFIRSGCCTVIGSFSPGDVATVHPSLAAHLVSQAMVAEFDAARPAVDQPAVVLPVPAGQRRAKRARSDVCTQPTRTTPCL